MTKKEAIHFLYQIADEIRSFLDKTSSPKGQWTSHKRLEALSMAISALYDLFQAEEDGRLIIPPCKIGDTVSRYESEEEDTDARIKLKAITLPNLKPCYGKCNLCIWKYNGGCSEWNGWGTN